MCFTVATGKVSLGGNGFAWLGDGCGPGFALLGGAVGLGSTIVCFACAVEPSLLQGALGSEAGGLGGGALTLPKA